MKGLLTLVFFFAWTLTFSQITVDFESFDIPIDTFDNGSNGSGGFTEGSVFLANNYIDDPQFPSWSGWAISTKRDTVTRGFTNQYSAFPGEGFSGSATYALSFGSTNVLQLTDGHPKTIDGFYITNSTYVYYSILEGDQFARKFGGETGEEPDYFSLSIKKFLGGELSADSVKVFLADYRTEEKFIMDEWTYIDLSSLGEADSLHFTMATTVINDFGPATPFYFCMDNLIIQDDVTSLKEAPQLPDVRIFPNPTTDYLNIEVKTNETLPVQLFDANGRILRVKTIGYGFNQLDLSTLPEGGYRVKVGKVVKTLIKAN